ncbi:MAG: YjbQ family protein [Candidatus Schekmanbacteria bacterium]|nr:MAG: YjbQ family protein [Candidatus Schekmanbacteria bacterium]
MPSYSEILEINTKGYCDIVDITGRVEKAVYNSKITNGIVVVFIPGATAGLTTIEYESGAIQDLKEAIERIAPENIHYSHDARWGDGNGFAHVRAALIGASLSIPLIDKNLSLGTWQQIVCIDFDNRHRRRKIVVQVCGD